MTRLPLLAALVLGAFALSGCAAASSPTPSDSSAPCEVVVVVNFGPLDEPSVDGCAAAGPAADVLAAAGVTTEGTVDYGDQVVCRVNGQPSPDEEVVLEGEQPFLETCETLNDLAYWALWIKTSADADWEYAQEGVATLELAPGQSVGLVYTPIAETIEP
jgi:hypothetical protein